MASRSSVCQSCYDAMLLPLSLETWLLKGSKQWPLKYKVWSPSLCYGVIIGFSRLHWRVSRRTHVPSVLRANERFLDFSCIIDIIWQRIQVQQRTWLTWLKSHQSLKGRMRRIFRLICKQNIYSRSILPGSKIPGKKCVWPVSALASYVLLLAGGNTPTAWRLMSGKVSNTAKEETTGRGQGVCRYRRHHKLLLQHKGFVLFESIHCFQRKSNTLCL